MYIHKKCRFHNIQFLELYDSRVSEALASISMAAKGDKKWRSGRLYRNTITLFGFVLF